MNKNIVETLKAEGCTKFLNALESTDLIKKLAGKGPFTVFAPDDEAFSDLSKDDRKELLKDKKMLEQILAYHILHGRYTVDALEDLGYPKTLQGKAPDIVITDGHVEVDIADVSKPDILASNGVIHIIDTVLIPSVDLEDPITNV